MPAVVQDCNTKSYAAKAKEKAIARQKATTMNKAREYIATLCHMKDGGLMPYDSERFIATTKAEAAAKAQKWAMATVGIVVEKTWLQVTLDGASMYTKELRVP